MVRTVCLTGQVVGQDSVSDRAGGWSGQCLTGQVVGQDSLSDRGQMEGVVGQDSVSDREGG